MNKNLNIYAVWESIVIFLKLPGPLIIRIGIDAIILRPFIQQINVDMKHVKKHCFNKVFHTYHVSGSSSRICPG